MSSLQIPKQEMQAVDPETGKMSKEWYRYFSDQKKATGPSPTANDDATLFALWPEQK